KRPLRQAEFERRALAFVAGLVTSGQNHRYVGTSPRMLRQILGGLSDPVLCAGLGEHEREVGRAIERTRGVAVGALVAEQLEHRLRADNAVVILKLVGELQRAARLALRLFGEPDRRRLVGNRGELPCYIARSSTAHGGRAGLVDHEPALLGTLGVVALAARGRLGEAAACRHIETNSGRADN